MRILTIMSLLVVVVLPAIASENTIYLHNGQLEARVPSEWVIIAHNPKGNRTAAGFQLLGNKAEEGTGDSTNLSVTTFYLKDTESMLAFVQPLTKKPEEGERDSEFGEWAIREWSGDQGDTKYRIIDARLSHVRLSVGIHVRLAWPLLEKNPKDYENQMQIVLHTILKRITDLNRSHVEKNEADQSATAEKPKSE